MQFNLPPPPQKKPKKWCQKTKLLLSKLFKFRNMIFDQKSPLHTVSESRVREDIPTHTCWCVCWCLFPYLARIQFTIRPVGLSPYSRMQSVCNWLWVVIHKIVTFLLCTRGFQICKIFNGLLTNFSENCMILFKTWQNQPKNRAMFFVLTFLMIPDYQNILCCPSFLVPMKHSRKGRVGSEIMAMYG